MNAAELFGPLREALAGGGNTSIAIVIAVILLILLVGGVALYISYLLSPRGRMDLLLQAKSRPKASPWPGRIVLLVILAMVPLALQLYGNQPATCASCHSKPDYRKALKTSVHRDVTCVACHAAPGATGPLRDGITYARWAWASYIEQKAVSADNMKATVDPDRCLGCHARVSNGVVAANGIRVRHSDFLVQGVTCTDCHDDTGHGDIKSAIGPKMSDCLPCHDGVKAPSSCGSCHVRDLALPASSAAYGTPDKIKVTADRDSCYVCHAERPCIACHGVRMPHPTDWAPSRDASANILVGTHARAGFVNRDVCYRCHFKQGAPFKPSNEGCPCHGRLGTMHGGRPWVREHGLEATGQKGGELSECFICHTSSLCGYCHEGSYESKYAPIGGYDNYRREVPRTPSQQALVESM